jgi:type II secretory pathway pseudopilin PulG
MRRIRTNKKRGSSLIEVLIAFAILLLLMTGILQMFSLAILTNYGSAARTELTTKAQQTIEVLRLAYGLSFQGRTEMLTAAGLPTTLAVTTADIKLPYKDGDTGTTLPWAFWGPAGENIIDVQNGPYKLSYGVQDGGRFWLVRVTALPVDAVGNDTSTSQSRRYLGPGTKVKRVDYVAQIPKPI